MSRQRYMQNHLLFNPNNTLFVNGKPLVPVRSATGTISDTGRVKPSRAAVGMARIRKQ